jgi:hypothetical protein
MAGRAMRVRSAPLHESVHTCPGVGCPSQAPSGFAVWRASLLVRCWCGPASEQSSMAGLTVDGLPKEPSSWTMHCIPAILHPGSLFIASMPGGALLLCSSVGGMGTGRRAGLLGLLLTRLPSNHPAVIKR